MTNLTSPFPWQAVLRRLPRGEIAVDIWNPITRRWQEDRVFPAGGYGIAPYSYVAAHNAAQLIENEEFGCNGEQGPVSGWKE